MKKFENEKNITQTEIWRNNYVKKEKKNKNKRLKIFELFENNQPILQCLVKRKNIDRIP